MILGDKLIVKCRCRGGGALVVIGDNLHRNLLIIGFHEDAAVSVHFLGPVLQPSYWPFGADGEITSAGVERSNLDHGRRRRLRLRNTSGGHQPRYR